MKLKDILMGNKSALFAGIAAGIAAPSAIFAAQDYPQLAGTNTERLREDLNRVSNDFWTVIERESDGRDNK